MLPLQGLGLLPFFNIGLKCFFSDYFQIETGIMGITDPLPQQSLLEQLLNNRFKMHVMYIKCEGLKYIIFLQTVEN